MKLLSPSFVLFLSTFVSYISISTVLYNISYSCFLSHSLFLPLSPSLFLYLSPTLSHYTCSSSFFQSHHPLLVSLSLLLSPSLSLIVSLSLSPMVSLWATKVEKISDIKSKCNYPLKIHFLLAWFSFALRLQLTSLLQPDRSEALETVRRRMIIAVSVVFLFHLTLLLLFFSSSSHASL